MSSVKVGSVVYTPGIQELMDGALGMDGIRSSIERHQRGDWGDICEEDAEANNDCLESNQEDGRLMSVYKYGDDTVWIITENHFGQEGIDFLTTILTPKEY